MDSVKVGEDYPAGNTVRTLEPVLVNGGVGAVTYSLVSGKFAIDNDKFTIDAQGNIDNINILVSGIYWIRYRVTVGFNFVEKGLKIYTDDQEVEITLSSTSYASDIATSGVVSTVSLSAGSTSDVTITPQSDEDDSGLPAFEYDGPSGEIRWSGDQSPLDYTYNIQYTGACIKPILNQEFTAITIDELGLATCSYPGLGAILGTRLASSGYQSVSGNDWVNVKTSIDASGTSLVNPGLLVGYLNNPVGFTNLQRYYYTVDTSSIVDKIACKITWSSNQTNRKFVVVYTTDAEPAVSNVTYDMPTWNILGSINNPTSATETIEFDMDSLPRNAALRIGIMIVNDYENDSTGMTGTLIPTNGFRLGTIQFYKCS